MNILLNKFKMLKIITLTVFLGISSPCYSEMDPKITALGTMAVYGTVGGFLLGVASLAFGTSGRAVAQGSSLGLYAGLLFGGYVVGSHAMNKRNKKIDTESEDYYPDTQESPYESYFFKESELKKKIVMQISDLTHNKLANVSLKKNQTLFNDTHEKIYYIPLLNLQF